ncbi:MAG: hypothetical protein D6738_01470 [Acidobacteria bacterium]|nr:MAG: hypothetical protein D6738_01470 [Acidobacteriota bacterium]
MIADADVLRRLEWPELTALVAERARTPMGREAAAQLVPLDALEQVVRRHDQVAELRAHRREHGGLPLGEVADPRPALAALEVRDRTLPGEAIYDLVHLAVVAREVQDALRRLDPERFPALGAAWARFPDLSGPVDAIWGRIRPGGELEDDASPDLARLRREIRALSGQLSRTLEELVRREWPGPVLRDRFVTIRNDRFVVPVRSDTPRRFEGIVHGHSASEKTLFVEPIETVEINNRLVRTREEERQEVDRILRRYTDALRAVRDDLALTADVLGEIDLLGAIAELADDEDAVRPELDPDGGLVLRAARHPLLERALRTAEPPRAIVPLDVDLPRDLHGLVISGPNAGGKTVALKTIGLLVLMAHAGLPVPAAAARFPAFSRVFADIGDEQSLAGSLSTFASHVRNLAAMVRRARPPALCLIDEIGTGTDPAEGAALGMAVLEHLLGRGVHVVATTHHQAIKAWAYRHDATLNAACEFDERTMRPTYRLIPGLAGASIGLTMAEQLGLDPDVVADARRRLDPGGADAVRALDELRELARDLERQREALTAQRRALREERERLERRFAEREQARRREWERRVAEMVDAFRADAERALRGIEDRRLRRQLDLERARQERALREKFSEEARAARRREPPPADWRPAPGAAVHVVPLGRDGVLTALDGTRAEVRLGRSTFTVAASDLRPAGGGTAPAPARPAGPTLPEGVSAELAVREVPAELHLIGLRVDEAVPRLERYLDEAALSGRREVRVVHGFGTGRLRKAVREALAAHPAVRAWRDGAPAEGGAGATVVELEEVT